MMRWYLNLSLFSSALNQLWDEKVLKAKNSPILGIKKQYVDTQVLTPKEKKKKKIKIKNLQAYLHQLLEAGPKVQLWDGSFWPRMGIGTFKVTFFLQWVCVQE